MRREGLIFVEVGETEAALLDLTRRGKRPCISQWTQRVQMGAPDDVRPCHDWATLSNTASATVSFPA